MDTIRLLEDRYGDLRLAVRCLKQPKTQIQGNSDGSWKKLTAAVPVPALRKGHIRKGPGRDIIARGTPKRRTFGNRR